jgi:PAS domain S-box-containing protein
MQRNNSVTVSNQNSQYAIRAAAEIGMPQRLAYAADDRRADGQAMALPARLIMATLSTRLTLAMVILVLFTAVTVGVFAHYSVEAGLAAGLATTLVAIVLALTLSHPMASKDVAGEAVAERMFRLAVELCPCSMVMVDGIGKIVLVNGEIERLFGYSREELIGQPIEILVPARLHSQHVRHRDGFVTAPETCRVGVGRELFGARKDGTEIPVEVSLNPIRTREGILILSVIADISERKRMERLKDEFVSTVSHELRTPLTSIAGSLGLLVGQWAGKLPESASRLLVIAHKNSQRLVRLINDILDIEKMESGRFVFDMKRVEVCPLIEQTIEASRGFAEGYGVRVRLDPECKAVDVRADPDRLAQIVINLLSNAIKFSPPGEEVVVEVETRGETVRISVRDHGHGVPVEFRPRIFEQFAQADATDARQKGGSGLGLSIVKRIVDQLGGEVGFDDAPGGGTIFRVDLPVWDTAVDQEIDFEAETSIPRILHLDDDHDVLAAVAGALGTTAEVVSVDSIEDARRALADDRYDLAVLDISLGTASVLDFLPDLRNSQGDMIPAIIFAAHGADMACDEQIGAALSKSQTSIESLVAKIHDRLAHLPARNSTEAA